MATRVYSAVLHTPQFSRDDTVRKVNQCLIEVKRSTMLKCHSAENKLYCSSVNRVLSLALCLIHSSLSEHVHPPPMPAYDPILPARHAS